jgi:hypothetical protein
VPQSTNNERNRADFEKPPGGVSSLSAPTLSANLSKLTWRRQATNMEESNTSTRSDMLLVKVPPRKITPGMREALTALVRLVKPTL